MHGRPRQRAGDVPSSDVNKKEQAQVAELRRIMPLFLESNRTCCYSTESMIQNARLLELNPEFYTAWNYRKRAVQHLLGLESDEEARKRIAQTELDLVVRALKANPKSYGAWYHRKWVMRLGLSSPDAEFVLLKKLLKLDCRNFHGWNYRRFVAKTKGVSAEEELIFTTDKINENFSDYSAWHNRSALLSEIYRNEAKGGISARESLEEEYELVQNSFYTDPDDQSGWFYYSWLLGQTIAPLGTHINGSWPPAQSQVVINLKAKTYKLSSIKSFVGLETLPLVLSFSNSVTGVNNQTVSVSIDEDEALELDWRPVKPWEKYCLKWTAEIMHHFVPKSENSTVKILVSAGPGIVSQDGQGCGSPWRSRFHVQLVEVSLNNEDRILGMEEADMHLEEAAGSNSWQLKVLEREIQSCRDLLELESNSKWTRLTLARLLLAHATYNTNSRKSCIGEARTHFEKLAGLDPTHKQYYEHQLSLLVLKELTEDRNSLRIRYEEDGELQLKQLSLCCIEFTERFLWVQRLDISNNQLRSCDGLEALQLLVYLNLSHNRIGSITALAPLRGLLLLDDVDVSFNHIGMHSVDTCRVLFPSQLSHNTTLISHINTKPHCANFHTKGGKYWEVKAVFQGLYWGKLNIAGNPAAENVEFVDVLKSVIDGTMLVLQEDIIL